MDSFTNKNMHSHNIITQNNTESAGIGSNIKTKMFKMRYELSQNLKIEVRIIL